MIPEFDVDGDLPPSVHVATLEEIGQRFGKFSQTDRRPQLFAKLSELVEAARAAGVVDRFIIAGSFVTAKAVPNDVDILIIFNTATNLTQLRPDQRLLVDRDAVRRRFRGDDLDVLPVRNSTQRMQAALEFFQYNRDAKLIGIVEVIL
ncbi:hypothetical protein HYR99_13800 [Candidatus Poribacteria bacterium]|nr:hypothetical protein [Candidatus Poribacteria bacterium]